MAKFSKDSKLGDLLESQGAKDVLDKHIPGMSSNAQLKMAASMSLSSIAGFAGISADKLNEIDAELQAVE